MLIYLTTMLLSVCICLRMQMLRAGRQGVLMSAHRTQVFYCLVLIAVLSVVVGWRKCIGTDYGNYIDIYSLTQGKTYSQILGEDEPFFGIINLFCSDFFHDYLPVFVFVAILSVVLIVYGIYQNSTNYALSVFLLIAGMYYFDLFNGMRQMISTAIMFAAYPLIKKKKWIWLIVLTIVSAQFHASAYIIFAAFVFSYYIKPKSLGTILLVSAFLFIFLQFESFSKHLVDFLISSESNYANYETTLSQTDMGANILRFGLTAVPAILSIVFWRYLKLQGKDAEILVNLSVINSCFMLIATKNWIFARFCMFFGIYNILLWPRILDCFEPRSKRIMTAGVIVVYFAYFWLIVHTDSNLLPYQSWLFGGVYA